jgi:hypothetical protein
MLVRPQVPITQDHTGSYNTLRCLQVEDRTGRSHDGGIFFAVVLEWEGRELRVGEDLCFKI